MLSAENFNHHAKLKSSNGLCYSIYSSAEKALCCPEIIWNEWILDRFTLNCPLQEGSLNHYSYHYRLVW